MANSTFVPDHRNAISLFARLGYAIRDAVYLLVGGLTMLGALGGQSVLAAIYRHINPAM